MRTNDSRLLLGLVVALLILLFTGCALLTEPGPNGEPSPVALVTEGARRAAERVQEDGDWASGLSMLIGAAGLAAAEAGRRYMKSLSQRKRSEGEERLARAVAAGTKEALKGE